MALTNEQMRSCIQRILLSRMRILCRHGFYGLLLMHMSFYVDEKIKTAATDGKAIIFGPEFLERLSDSELDFVLMHEVLHCVLQHSVRGGKRDDVMYNLACDLVVNSTILKSNHMDLNSITIKGYETPMHALPDGTEGCELSVEEAYVLLNKDDKMKKLCKDIKREMWDNHTKWGSCEDDDTLSDVWTERFKTAWNSISVRDPSHNRGLCPAFAQRMYEELTKSKIDWRTLLTNFVQENVKDYTFSPPDRRFSESPFFLPDFNDCDAGESVKNVLFMIDTSGSVSDQDMTRAYSEIKGAIDQFDGRLTGKLGFFDAAVIEPLPFCDEDELEKIKPVGGGGTDFQIIFDYVNKYMKEDPPSNIVILTDGYAPFPKEQIANGIPVMWLINNATVNPPWGKVARML